MTAHIMNTDIDPDRPATLSPIFLEDILRDGLSYDGVIISDDMQMGAITSQFGFDEAIIKAVNAGCDLLIFSNNGSEYDEDIARKAAGVIFSAVNNIISLFSITHGPAIKTKGKLLPISIFLIFTIT